MKRPRDDSVYKNVLLDIIPNDVWKRIFMSFLIPLDVFVLLHVSKNIYEYICLIISELPNFVLKIDAIFLSAFQRGNLDLLKWAQKKSYQIYYYQNECIEATKYGHLDIIKWIHTTKGLNLFGVCEEAASHGHLHILNWIRDNYNEMVPKPITMKNMGCTPAKTSEWMWYTIYNRDFFRCAAETNQINVFEWAKKQGNECIFDDSATFAAVWNGNIDALKWLRKNDCPCYPHIAMFAAKKGHLEMVQFLYKDGYEITNNTLTHSIVGGNLELVKWLIGMLTPFPRFDADMCFMAASHNKLEILKWLRERGYSWDSRVFSQAKAKGHLELLQWAIENKCPQE